MPICVNKKVKKTALCSGDMDKLISIVQRVISPPLIGSINPVTTFTSILDPWAMVETVDTFSRRFSGINIENRPTHIFSIFYDDTIWTLDSDNNFIKFDDRLFRIIRAADLNELKVTIQMLCTERGVDSLEGSKA